MLESGVQNITLLDYVSLHFYKGNLVIYLFFIGTGISHFTF